MKRERPIFYWLIFAGMLMCAGCAQQGAPTGGPVDEEPPVVLKTSPQNYSTNFEGGKISITFDEYLDMANFTQELVVSPPMEEKPVIKLKNKTLLIEFEEKLKEDVTYTFNFGEGIKDLNEKNVLLNYEYVFATGDLLDSLSVKGTLKNAFDLTVPESPINVMLYHSLEDSLPMTEIPYYVGRTDSEGNFAVNNLRAGVYKLFVLKDGNNNFLFDLPNEEIAFLDTSLLVDGAYFRRILQESGVYDPDAADTMVLDVDTAGMGADTIAMLLDSLEQAKPDLNSLYIDLFMFTEEAVNQFISEYERKERHLMELQFNIPVTDSFAFSPFYPPTMVADDLIPEFGLNRDSLVIYAADTVAAAFDTIGLTVDYTVLDTLDLPYVRRDTLQFVYRERTIKKGSKKSTPVHLQVSTIKNRGQHHIEKDILFTLNEPLKGIDPELFELYIIPDTIEIPVQAGIFIDTTHLRRVRLQNEWKEEADYRMVVYPGAISNVYGKTNDTIDVKFQIKPLAAYGRINLSLENVSDTLLIQIFNSKKMVRSRTVTTSEMFVFDFLDPGTYHIKFIHDRNGNGKWDTGKYIEGLQPEKVEFVPRKINVRANWDHGITYVMGSSAGPPASPEEEESEAPLFQ
ncbi:MAG: Ig-like domain-containing protein [Bacteroidales bacterium]|nr:Ig-like domain-containing protein [Bacteroidales bacterium]